MQKLTEQSDLNSPQEYDKIFFERQKKGVDEHDMRRWKRLLKYYKGGQLIDLGCLDSGIWKIRKRGYYLGIDVAEEAIKVMKKAARPVGGLTCFEVGDVYNLQIRRGGITEGGAEFGFDYAIMGEILEHLSEPEKAIKESMRILKPGGVLAISTPLEEAREPGAVDKDRHLWSFTKRDIEDMCRDANRMTGVKMKFETVGSLFTWKPPFYRYCWPSLIAFAWKN